MDDVLGRTLRKLDAFNAGDRQSLKENRTGPARTLRRRQTQSKPCARWNSADAAWRSGEFFKSLSTQAMREFESLAKRSRCHPGTVLLSEGDQPLNALFLLDGRVEVPIGSACGNRMTLAIAEPGDILGLCAAVSGFPSEITAEAQSPCRFASLPRQRFLKLYLRDPIASHCVARLLGQEHRRTLDRVRMLDHRTIAPGKVARFLTEWCSERHEAGPALQIQCSLTQAEICQRIGLPQETVSRTVAEFMRHNLLQQNGSDLLIPSLGALEEYAERLDA